MNNMVFWIAQFIGLIAVVLLILSYYRKNTNEILVIQIVSAICYCIHYFMLGAFSGFFICFFEMMRDYAYYKSTKDIYIFLFTIPFYIFFGIVNVQVFIDVLPILASTTDGYFLTKSKKFVLVGSIISHLLWIVYDYSVKSYSGVLTCIIVLVSNTYILLFDKGLEKRDINTHIDGFERK